MSTPKVPSSSRRQKLRKQCIARDGSCCYYCGWALTFEEATLDHVVPQADGGKWELDNLVIACEDCNIEKSNLPIELFRIYRWLTRGRRTWRLRLLRKAGCAIAKRITGLRFPGELRREVRA